MTNDKYLLYRIALVEDALLSLMESMNQSGILAGDIYRIAFAYDEARKELCSKLEDRGGAGR